ncbi:hypothetical protein [Actinomadura sp. 9N407]|uniref:hypothetical protein n=1 Tax=Actinomadura sp. 9N407 TaxID=3375154 RepID=UPI0037969101
MNEIELLARLGSEVPPMPERARRDARAALMERARTENAEPVRTPVPSPAPPARRRGLLRLGAAALTAAAAVAVAVAVPWGQDAPAYAVEKKPDGSTEIRIREFLEPKRLQASLREAGVPAVVDYVPDGQSCRPRAWSAVPAGQAPALSQAPGGSGGTVLRIAPGRFAPNHFLVIEASFDQDDPARAGGVAMQVVKGPVAACEAAPVEDPERVRIPGQGGNPAEPAGQSGSGASRS